MITSFWRSLRLRLTLAMLSLVLLTLWATAFVASRSLHLDLQQVLARQQFSVVSFVAREIEQNLRERLGSLEATAPYIDAGLLADQGRLQRFLDNRPSLLHLFNWGLVVVDAHGLALASSPSVLQRTGTDYHSVPAIRQVLAQGRWGVTPPLIGKRTGEPVFSLVVPIKEASGKVIGALLGVTNLSQANFLDELGRQRYGHSGGFLLIDTGSSTIVTASDKSRVMTPSPARGVNLQHDRYVDGFQGSGVAVSSRGVEELSSGYRVGLVNWLVVATLPTAEAFAPIHEMQHKIIVAAAVLTLIAGLVAWLILRAELRPLQLTAKQLRQMSAGEQPLEPLPEQDSDEMNRLAESFNALLRSNAESLQALAESEQRFREMADAAPVLIWMSGLDKQCNYFNRFWLQFTGRTLEQEMGDGWVEGVHPDDLERCVSTYVDAFDAREPFVMEYRIRHYTGEYRWIIDRGVPRFDGKGEFLGYIGGCSDITHVKQMDELRIAAAAFQTQEGIVITDAQQQIIRVNHAFTQLTGYAPQDVIGQTPRVLNSGRHEPAFYQAMWASVTEHGNWQGEIWNRRKNGEIYPEWLTITAVRDSNGAVTHYVGAFTDITERKAAEQQIRSLAFFDSLTNLPNRRLLLDRLGQAMAASQRSEQFGALLFIDLDNFKQINDTAGHAVGDHLLQSVAQRLSENIRSGDTVARLGGDEFVLMLEDLGREGAGAADQACTVAQKMLEILRPGHELDGHFVVSTPSIGVTLFQGRQVSLAELVKQADIAMYQAKARGRNGWCFFDPSIQRETERRVELENELRLAVVEGQWELHYQVQVAADARPVGAEILIRWRHPQRGMVSPAEFIPLAEETGLILPLGHYVLHQACRQLAAWKDEPAAAGLTLAVNVSARQFRSPSFITEVRELLRETGAPPHLLKLEITESLLLEDVDVSIQSLTELKELGVRFSLDDFGTGYSSLAYLKRLPIDQVKIDQSFVRDILTDPNDATIARTIIALGQSFGVEVIAEGVETQAHHDFLVSHGCRLFQGYLHGRPEPLAAFAQRLGLPVLSVDAAGTDA